MNSNIKVGDKITQTLQTIQLNGNITTEYITMHVISISEKYISIIYGSDFDFYNKTTDPAKKRRKIHFISYKELKKIMG